MGTSIKVNFRHHCNTANEIFRTQAEGKIDKTDEI